MLISVIIPVHNMELYLAVCLDSVLNQTYADMEIICVNDGSTDESREILELYAAKDSRVQVINQENQGVSAARNCGLAEAKGEYTFCLDADDWLDADCLASMLARAKETAADIVVADFYFERANDKRDYAQELDIPETVLQSGVYLERFFQRGVYNNLIGLLVAKRVYARLESWLDRDITIGEDLEIVLRLYFVAEKIARLNRAFYHYRQQSLSAMATVNANEHLRQVSRVLERLARFFAARGLAAEFAVYHAYMLENLLKKYHRSAYEQQLYWENLAKLTELMDKYRIKQPRKKHGIFWLLLRNYPNVHLADWLLRLSKRKKIRQ